MIRIVSVLGLILLLAACAGPGGGHRPTSYPSDGYDADGDDGRDGGYYDRNEVRCRECGVVEGVERVSGARAAAGDAPLGGIVGGVLDDEDDEGATAARTDRNDAANRDDAASPARSGAPRYEIRVRFDDGRGATISQRDLGGIRAGQRVRVHDGRVERIDSD